MKFINRILAAVLALALGIVGVLVVIEVVAAAFGARPAVVHWHPVLTWARRTAWDSGGVQIACVVVAIAGLVLLVAELKPRRPTRLTVSSDDTDAAFTRRGVAAAIRSAVGDVDGISSSSVQVRRRRVKVRASTGQATESAAGLADSARQTAQSRLDELELEPAPRLRFNLDHRES